MVAYYKLSEEENKKYEAIDKSFDDFIENLSSHGVYDVEELRKAYDIAKYWHKGVCRKSGEFYLYHPLAVCKKIAADGFADANILIAALLHDTVEDTEYTLDKIKEDFGQKVRCYVQAVTKIESSIDPLDGKTKKLAQYLTDEHMLEFGKEYPFALYIKFADRWHNLHTSQKMSPESIKRNVAHTKSVLIPLARKLGCNFMADELNDACFLAENPTAYQNILIQQENFFLNAKKGLKKTIEAIKTATEKFAEIDTRPFDSLPFQIMSEIKELIQDKKAGLASTVRSSKSYTLNLNRTDLFTAYGYQPCMVCFFKMLNPTSQSYPKQFSDLCRKLLENQTITVLNEKELTSVNSAHVSCIEIEDQYFNRIKIVVSAESEFWKFSNAIALHKHIPTTIEGLRPTDNTRIYTRDGIPWVVPQKCTALDFAFILHEDIGLHYLSATVNDKEVTMDYLLQSNDKIEVKTSPTPTARVSWFPILETRSARTKLTAFIEKSK